MVNELIALKLNKVEHQKVLLVWLENIFSNKKEAHNSRILCSSDAKNKQFFPFKLLILL